MEKDAKVLFAVQMVYNHPCKLLTFSFLIAITCSVLSLGYIDLANPRAGLRLRDHITAERSDAWLLAMFELRDQYNEIPRRHSVFTRPMPSTLRPFR